MTAFAPCSTAFETAIVMPRSLNEPVGFMPSNLTQTFAPVRASSAGAGMSGVPPSPSVMIGVASVTSRRSRYSCSTPRHWWHHLQSFDSEHARDLGHRLVRLQGRDGRGERGLRRLMRADHQGSGGRGVAVASDAPTAARASTETPCSLNSVAIWREHAGLVDDLEGDLVAGGDARDRQDRAGPPASTRRRRGRRSRGGGRPRRGRRARPMRSGRRRRPRRRTSGCRRPRPRGRRRCWHRARRRAGGRAAPAPDARAR